MAIACLPSVRIQDEAGIIQASQSRAMMLAGGTMQRRNLPIGIQTFREIREKAPVEPVSRIGFADLHDITCAGSPSAEVRKR
jgi:hypothetical protein